jgi:hypothetical protein
MGYKVANLPEFNQPANILEEIVWYKAKEIEVFRDKQPLPTLMVRLGVSLLCVCSSRPASEAKGL